jgi:hypothetical protein
MYKDVENNNKSLLVLFSNQSIVLILTKEQGARSKEQLE